MEFSCGLYKFIPSGYTEDENKGITFKVIYLREVFGCAFHFDRFQLKHLTKKRVFYSPGGNCLGSISGPSNINNSDAEIQHLQLMIGSKMYPEYPIRSHSEAFYQLKKTLGVQTSDIHSFDINPRQWCK